MGQKYRSKCNATPEFPEFDEDELLQLEADLGVTLPDEYREFLHEWNGVVFELDEHVEHAVCPVQAFDNHTEHVPEWGVWTADRRASVFDSVACVERLFWLTKPASDINIPTLFNSNELFGFNLWARASAH